MKALLLLALIAATATGQGRRVSYIGADFGDYKPIPKFDKGYLIYANRFCDLTVFAPTGAKQFSRKLEAPGGLPCAPNDVAIDTDGSAAVAVSFEGSLGFTGAILFLDATGKQTSAIETGRYEPAHIGLDRNRAIWTIGSKRDEVNGSMLEKGEYFLVRKFSRDGKQLGEFIPRSLWGPRGDPGDAPRGYWHLAVARDRVAAIIHESFSGQTPELLEWDLDGKVISQAPIPGGSMCGRAYTHSGKLYAKFLDTDSKTFGLYVLDTATRQWTPTGQRTYVGEQGILLGADGDDLVYSAPSGMDLIWQRP
jgi:hypothetical protein